VLRHCVASGVSPDVEGRRPAARKKRNDLAAPHEKFQLATLAHASCARLEAMALPQAGTPDATFYPQTLALLLFLLHAAWLAAIQSRCVSYYAHQSAGFCSF
jgi:hypothetical protein